MRINFFTVSGGILLVGLTVFSVAVWKKTRKPVVMPKPYRFPTAELAALDWVVQERFAVNPVNDFGMSRVGQRHEYFQAKTRAETAAIEGLGRAKQQVLFYVVGRVPALNLVTGGQREKLVQGPIYMGGGKLQPVENTIPTYDAPLFRSTGKLPVEGLPTEEEVFAVGRRVFRERKFSAGYSDQSGEWHMEAVPVLASQQQCADCHNRWAPREKDIGLKDIFRKRWDTVRVGDSLGVAIYYYRTEKGQP